MDSGKPVKKISNIVSWVVALAVLAGILLFAYDLLFSKPGHLKGTVVEKIYVPSYSVSSGRYGSIRRGNYAINTVKEEQWIAVVKLDTGDTLTVHCHVSHYENTNVGDVISFNKYEGHLFHIKYFAHNEEE
jgi:hypothetical protein